MYVGGKLTGGGGGGGRGGRGRGTSWMLTCIGAGTSGSERADYAGEYAISALGRR